MTPSSDTKDQDFRVGNWVEVRSREEIFATLDARGRLDALPFMPEMLQYCGKRFRVYKSAHKTCDTIETYRGRRMTRAVHLEGLRCDGQAHGGCQAQCLLFWKEAWLKSVRGPEPEVNPRPQDPAIAAPYTAGPTRPGCDAAALERATRRSEPGAEEVCYSCQATDLVRATTPLGWWEPRSYVKDIISGNVRLAVMLRCSAIAAINAAAFFILRRILRVRAWVHPYPYMRGLATDSPPSNALRLQPGELVQVRTKEEIMRSLNSKLRHRGLSFDVEAVQYCGKTFRVHSRVDRIINEKTGAMIVLHNDCIILEGATCSGCYSSNRMFCPRSVYPYWREIWLKRVKESRRLRDGGASAAINP
jgi:hypothetical protein